MASKIQVRRDTAANWTAANPTLAQGEPGLETDTLYLKFGDGATAWNALAYYWTVPAETDPVFAAWLAATPPLYPAGDASALTNFPTFNQDTTGKSAEVGLAAGGDHTGKGVHLTLTAEQNQAIGDVCYIKNNGNAQLAKADVIANANAIVIVAEAAIGAAASGKYLVQGIVRDDSWGWTVGGLIYLSLTGTTGNTLTQVAPSGANEVIQVLGVALSATTILFSPSLVQVVHV